MFQKGTYTPVFIAALFTIVKTWAQSLQSCPTLCDPMDHGPPGSSVHGILQERKLGWVSIPSPVIKYEVKWVKWSEIGQSYLTLCGPMHCSPPGSCVHGIFQARVLEWVAISFSNQDMMQSKCPYTDEWIKKVWCIRTMDYCAYVC